MTRVVGHFIGGKWESTDGRETGRREDPADSTQTVLEYVRGNAEDVARAVAAAKEAYPAWAKTPAPARGRIISKVAAIAMERSAELGAIMSRESGKVMPEAAGEVIKGANLLEWYGGEGFRMGGKQVPSEMPSTLLYTTRVPMGVVGLITPWNFPWAIPAWKIGPALVAGNTVVLKPAEQTPAIAEELCKLFEEAGLPPGVLNMVVGTGEDVGAPLCEHPDIEAISFTGSNEVGRIVKRTTADRFVKLTMEMGGKNAAIVMDDANVELAVAGVAKGAFGGTGQRCTATSRLVVQEGIHDEIVGKLKEAAEGLVVGPGAKETSTLGPLVDASQHEKVLAMIERAKGVDGVTLVTGGARPDGDDVKDGYFVQPTILTGVDPASELWQEEVFGPVLAVCKVKDFDEAMKVANDSKYGLASAFYSEQSSLIMRYIDEIETGMVHVNSPTIGGEAQVPFGGMKDTGYGDREMSEEGLRFFTEEKTVWIDYTGKPRTSNIY